MIQSKSDLSFYISEDNKQYLKNKGTLKRWGVKLSLILPYLWDKIWSPVYKRAMKQDRLRLA